MNTYSSSPLASAAAASMVDTALDDLQRLRDQWLWFLLAGIALVVFGSLAIGWSCLGTITIAATWLFGFLLLAGGITEIIHAFSAPRWSGTLMHVLIGVLHIAVGLMIIDDPGESALVLTKIISILLIVAGLFRIVTALIQRFHGWGWILLNGVVTLFLGILVYKQWPESALWFIGLYLGIDMIVNGWSYIMLALTLKQLPAHRMAA
jgi:uncharacterized membrane protein HdeD (DUF308 family)